MLIKSRSERIQKKKRDYTAFAASKFKYKYLHLMYRNTLYMPQECQCILHSAPSIVWKKRISMTETVWLEQFIGIFDIRTLAARSLLPKHNPFFRLVGKQTFHNESPSVEHWKGNSKLCDSHSWTLIAIRRSKFSMIWFSSVICYGFCWLLHNR